jgi:signal transduction histidine kinase
VGQLVRYSRELNGATSADEIGGYALEAATTAIDGTPSPTVIEVAGDGLSVLASTDGDSGIPEIARLARESGATRFAGRETRCAVEGVERAAVESEPEGTVLATSRVYEDDAGETGVVLVASWSGVSVLRDHHVKPLEYLGDHVATAVTNVRSRERLERARRTLAERTEMLRVYDRLLRHDLGNDLQVITSFARLAAERAEGEPADYAERIADTAADASELIDRVGEVVRTVEDGDEPQPRDLGPILIEAVENARTRFDSLTVEVDPDAVEARVYAGDLLGSIFSNIVSNAAVHNDEPVTVRVTVDRPTPDRVVVAIGDDGAGIPDGIGDGIFEMGRAGPDSEGTGFGLGLARALVDSYGGQLTAGESDSGGALFRVGLQRA